MPITVKDVISHLQTLPQDMEAWTVWDESGEYSPLTQPVGRIDLITECVARRGRRSRWEESYSGKGKPVCVMLPKH